MELHNTAEDIVLSMVAEIFESIEKKGNPEKYCLCDQCRMDTACYALNRTRPHYILSSRGVARVEQENISRQQLQADVASLIYDGIQRVNHNQRPNFSHQSKADTGVVNAKAPAFNIPTIVGRLFNGLNFSPIAGVKVELYQNGELVSMKDNNWQNPYLLVSNTEGTFTFWPEPVPSGEAEVHQVFEFSIRVESTEFETLNHFFKIPVMSEVETAATFSMVRTFRLPDLYMFSPGEEEDEILE